MIYYLIGQANDYWAAVPIQYQSFYALEETLAVFGAAPCSLTSLLSVYERLAGTLTDRQVRALGATSDETSSPTRPRSSLSAASCSRRRSRAYGTRWRRRPAGTGRRLIRVTAGETRLAQPFSRTDRDGPDLERRDLGDRGDAQGRQLSAEARRAAGGP